jgi:hypothetical protein
MNAFHCSKSIVSDGGHRSQAGHVEEGMIFKAKKERKEKLRLGQQGRGKNSN